METLALKVCKRIVAKSGQTAGKPGGGTPHIRGLGMLVVSFKGGNFGFWSHLGCFE